MEERVQERIGTAYTLLLEIITAFERKFTVKLQESFKAVTARIEKNDRNALVWRKRLLTMLTQKE